MSDVDVDVHERPGVCTECGRDHENDAALLRSLIIGRFAPALGTQMMAVLGIFGLRRMPRGFFLTAWARALGTVVGTQLGGIAAKLEASAPLGEAACGVAARALEHAFETEVARRRMQDAGRRMH